MATNLVIPSNLGAMSPEQKASAYTQQRLAGFSDPAIRNAVSGSVGPQSDQDWNYLLQLSGYDNVAPDALYRSPTSGNSLIAALRGGTPGLPAGSVSSYSMLPNRQPTSAPPPPTTSQQPYYLNPVTPFEAPTPSGGVPGTDRPGSPAPNPSPVGAPPPARALPNFTSWVSSDLSGEEKAALYNNYLQRGYTGQELRTAVEKTFGKQPEADWNALTNFASQQPKDLLPTNNSQGLFKSEIQQAVQKWKDSGAPAPAPIAAPAQAPEFIQPVSRETDDVSYLNLMDAALPDAVAQQPTAQPLTIEADFAAMSPQQKADLYNSYLGNYSDADIRSAIEAQLGPQPDEDWAYLRRLAAGGMNDGVDQQTPDDLIGLYAWNQF